MTKGWGAAWHACKTHFPRRGAQTKPSFPLLVVLNAT
jgi:hypothetical protein